MSPAPSRRRWACRVLRHRLGRLLRLHGVGGPAQGNKPFTYARTTPRASTVNSGFWQGTKGWCSVGVRRCAKRFIYPQRGIHPQPPPTVPFFPGAHHPALGRLVPSRIDRVPPGSFIVVNHRLSSSYA